VKPLDLRVAIRLVSHLRVATMWCCSRTSDITSMHARFAVVGMIVRRYFVKEMSISVRFSTPLSL